MANTRRKPSFRPNDIVTLTMENAHGHGCRLFGVVQPMDTNPGAVPALYVRWDGLFGQPSYTARFVYGSEPPELRHALPGARTQAWSLTENAIRCAELVRLHDMHHKTWPPYVLNQIKDHIQEMDLP